ncbi:RNA chaperone Hfq [Sphingomonas sp. ASV193]|uniref:RNA chaperone Hfq n=1 Tax=Sphingomonas sp. ASV193 TaxID=3144405 RepID=UPI0032E8ED45
MADKAPSLQDHFLNECRKAKVPVTVFLVKGVKLQGVITWFDTFSLLLRREGTSQLIFKHSISTIMPPALPPPPPEGPAPKVRPSLQDRFLAAAEAQAEPMTIFLVNGVMLQGTVAAHDQFVLLLTRGPQGQLVYKHAVSTMQPGQPLDLGQADDAAQDGGTTEVGG